MKRTLINIAIATGILAMSQQALAQEVTASKRAHEIAQKSIIMDTHIDAPWRLINNWEDLTQAAEKGDFDYARAKEGGLNVPFMAIYIPSSYENKGAFVKANHLIDFVESMVYRAPEKYAIPHSSQDIQTHFEQGLISLALGMENGAPIEGKLENVQFFYDRGVRYITLTHSEDNHIGDSSYDETGTWGGLSPFGVELVKEMNRVGMMVDISHVSDETFYDVLKVTAVPVIATHSSARHFTPNWERNMSDDMIKALAKNGGVIQVTFGSMFITEEANTYRERLSAQINTIYDKFGKDSAEAKAAVEKLYQDNPYPFAHLNDVLDHIDHIIKLVGIEHVGLGSDYDGVGDSLPVGLKDVSTFPNLIQGLLDRGYTEEQIDLILHGNTLRVWRAVEEAAAK